MASVSWVRIRSSSLEAFVLDGVGWFPGTQVLEWGIECTIVDFRKVVHSLGGSTQGPDIDRTRQPAISLLFWHILSCGMGCCLEHEFVNQLSIQTTFSDSQADYYFVIWQLELIVDLPIFVCVCEDIFVLWRLTRISDAIWITMECSCLDIDIHLLEKCAGRRIKIDVKVSHFGMFSRADLCTLDMQHLITGSLRLTHIFRCRNHMILFPIKTISPWAVLEIGTILRDQTKVVGLI